MSITIKNIIKLGVDGIGWIGYKVVMSDASKNIICKMNNYQQCYEDFDVVINPRLVPPSDFIGAEYYSVEVKDDDVNKYNDESYFNRAIIVIIRTNKGILTILLYNEHNGYYNHEIYIKTEKGEELTSL